MGFCTASICISFTSISIMPAITCLSTHHCSAVRANTRQKHYVVSILMKMEERLTRVRKGEPVLAQSLSRSIQSGRVFLRSYWLTFVFRNMNVVALSGQMVSPRRIRVERIENCVVLDSHYGTKMRLSCFNIINFCGNLLISLREATDEQDPALSIK